MTTYPLLLVLTIVVLAAPVLLLLARDGRRRQRLRQAPSQLGRPLLPTDLPYAATVLVTRQMQRRWYFARSGEEEGVWWFLCGLGLLWVCGGAVTLWEQIVEGHGPGRGWGQGLLGLGLGTLLVYRNAKLLWRGWHLPECAYGLQVTPLGVQVTVGGQEWGQLWPLVYLEADPQQTGYLGLAFGANWLLLPLQSRTAAILVQAQQQAQQRFAVLDVLEAKPGTQAWLQQVTVLGLRPGLLLGMVAAYALADLQALGWQQHDNDFAQALTWLRRYLERLEALLQSLSALLVGDAGFQAQVAGLRGVLTGTAGQLLALSQLPILLGEAGEAQWLSLQETTENLQQQLRQLASAAAADKD